MEQGLCLESGTAGFAPWEAAADCIDDDGGSIEVARECIRAAERQALDRHSRLSPSVQVGPLATDVWTGCPVR